MSKDYLTALYPNDAQVPPAAAQPQSSPVDTAGGFYPEPRPASVNRYALEPDSTATRLYGATEKVPLSADTDLSAFGSGAELDAVRDDLGYMAAAIGASQTDMRDFVDVVTEYTLAPPARVKYEDAMQALHREYGPAMKAKLRDAKELVDSLPGTANWLKKTGAGNDLRVIRQFIRFTETPKGQHRLSILRKGK